MIRNTSYTAQITKAVKAGLPGNPYYHYRQQTNEPFLLGERWYNGYMGEGLRQAFKLLKPLIKG